MTLKQKAIFFSVTSLIILLLFVLVFNAYRNANNELVKMLTTLDKFRHSSHAIQLEFLKHPEAGIDIGRTTKILNAIPESSYPLNQAMLSGQEIEQIINVELSFVRIERALNSYISHEELPPLLLQIDNEIDKINTAVQSFITLFDRKIQIRKQRIELLIFCIYILVALSIAGALYSVLNYFVKPVLTLSRQIEDIKHGRRENIDLTYNGDEIGLLAGFTRNTISNLKTKTQDALDSKKELEIQYSRQVALSQILKFSNERISLDEFLERVLESLLGLQCLQPDSQCAIFLREDSHEELVLRKSVNFSGNLGDIFSKTPIGRDIGCKVVETKEAVYIDEVSHEHGFDFKEIISQGLYCSPLVSENQLIGILLLCLPHNKKLNLIEREYLDDVVRILSDVLRRKQLEDELKQLAISDPLTDCFNRRHFLEQGALEFQRSMRYARPFTTLMIDVDHFKKINDEFGHAKGDETLISLAHSCKALLRKNDVFGRLGGEEFAVILAETNSGEAMRLAERIRVELSRIRMHTEKGHINFTVSIGVSEVRVGDNSFEDVIHRADNALYEAKTAGRNCVRECTL